MTRLCITSTANERLKAARRLSRRRGRDHAGVFLVEGHRQLRCALEAGAAIREVYAAPELYLSGTDAELVSAAERGGAHVLELGAAAFGSISRHVRPDGLAALVERWPTDLERLRRRARPLLLVAQGVERPGNLGTIVRTACGAGATALLVCDVRSDVFHPETVRGSVGTLFHLPVAECATDAAIAWLRDRRIRVLVATPHSKRPFWDVDYTGGVAVVVGGERYGVAEAWTSAAAACVRIPMPGPADSLNVAVAAGVVLFEATRQRAAAPGTTRRARPARPRRTRPSGARSSG